MPAAPQLLSADVEVSDVMYCGCLGRGTRDDPAVTAGTSVLVPLK